jgi:hypothetical protein
MRSRVRALSASRQSLQHNPNVAAVYERTETRARQEKRGLWDDPLACTRMCNRSPGGQRIYSMKGTNRDTRGSGRNFDFCYCKMKANFLQWFARV